MLLLVLVTSLFALPLPQQAAAEDLTRLPALELARRLPPVHSQGAWEEAADRYVLRPEVLEFRRRLQEGVPLNNEVWREALTTSGAIKVRSRWPVEVPFAVSIEWPAWLPGKELRLVPRPPLLAAVYRPVFVGCGNDMDARRDKAFHQTLGQLELGSRTLEFTWEVWAGRDRQHEPVREWSGTLSFAVEVLPTVEDALPTSTDPAVAEALLDSLRYRKGFLKIDPDVARHSVLASTGLSLAIDVLRGDAPVETVHLLGGRVDSIYQMNSKSTGRPRLSSYVPIASLRALESEPGDEWSLRIRGVDENAMKLWDAATLWRGEFAVQLAELKAR